MLDERELVWPRIRFSLGDTASRKVCRGAEADDDNLLRTNGIDYGSKFLLSFGGRGNEERLASGPALKFNHGLQLRQPLRRTQPRPASRQLLRLDRAELDAIDLQHRAKSIQDRALAGAWATDQDQSVAHRRILTSEALTTAVVPGNDRVVNEFVGGSGSLLGQLELGLGAGFLSALDAPSDEVCSMVLDCVDRDTRLDWDLDERADYYALLLLAADADVAAVEGVIAAHEPTGDDPEDHSTLPLDVLVRMGVRGSRGARDAIGRYLAHGVDVAGVLLQLQGDGERASQIPAWRSALEGLGSAV